MYIVKYTTAFKKSYKLMKKRGLNLTLLDGVRMDAEPGSAKHGGFGLIAAKPARSVTNLFVKAYGHLTRQRS